MQADDRTGLERLARYLLRPPVSLERLRLEPGLALYRHKRAARRDGEPFDPAELLARLLMHIPAPRLHLVRYYGRYSHVARARRRRQMEAVPGAGPQVPGADFLATGSPDDELSRAERRRLRRGWAQLIRRVYEADPLLCHRRTRCPGLMRAPHGRRTDRRSRSPCASTHCCPTNFHENASEA